MWGRPTTTEPLPTVFSAAGSRDQTPGAGCPTVAELSPPQPKCPAHPAAITPSLQAQVRQLVLVLEWLPIRTKRSLFRSVTLRCFVLQYRASKREPGQIQINAL